MAATKRRATSFCICLLTCVVAADTIRILIATDSHVGYNERDAIRGNDSSNSFHEVMCLAKARDVDMVLLAGDLFHDNKPSRKSMFEVMRSLRMNCYGEKPCELEMLSDPSECFQGYCVLFSLSVYIAYLREGLSIMSTTRTPISMWLFLSSRSTETTMILQGCVTFSYSLSSRLLTVARKAI